MQTHPNIEGGLVILLAALRALRTHPHTRENDPDVHPILTRELARVGLRRQLAEEWLKTYSYPAGSKALAAQVSQDEMWQSILQHAQVYIPAIDVMRNEHFRWTWTQDGSPKPEQPVLYYFSEQGTYPGIFVGDVGVVANIGGQTFMLGDQTKTFRSLFGEELQNSVSAWMPMPGFENWVQPKKS